MTQEDKNLLLKDLCARLPYGVKITWDGKYPLTVTPHIYCAIVSEDNINNLPKLLLRPMSSIAELITAKEWSSLGGINLIDWYNANHIDYRGLIGKDLAIEVTEENNPYKSNS